MALDTESTLPAGELVPIPISPLEVILMRSVPSTFQRMKEFAPAFPGSALNVTDLEASLSFVNVPDRFPELSPTAKEDVDLPTPATSSL